MYPQIYPNENYFQSKATAKNSSQQIGIPPRRNMTLDEMAK